MKTIGMIGGTGWVSSLEYYKLMNEFTNQKLGGLQAAKSIMVSLNYGEIDALNKTNNSEGVFNLVLEAAQKVEKAGADMLLLCANTMHQYADRISEAVKLPIIHIGEETAKTITAQNIKKVGLLGTIYTMEMDFYHAKLKEQGIEALVPEKEEREFIHSVIMNELLMNKFTFESKTRFLQIIEKLQTKGAEGIILGCTEIPLLINQADLSLPLFNTTEIHALAAVEAANNN